MSVAQEPLPDAQRCAVPGTTARMNARAGRGQVRHQRGRRDTSDQWGSKNRSRSPTERRMPYPAPVLSGRPLLHAVTYMLTSSFRLRPASADRRIGARHHGSAEEHRCVQIPEFGVWFPGTIPGAERIGWTRSLICGLPKGAAPQSYSLRVGLDGALRRGRECESHGAFRLSGGLTMSWVDVDNSRRDRRSGGSGLGSGPSC